MYRSSLFPVLILLKCLSVPVRAVSVTCLKKHSRLHRVSSLLMRSTPSEDSVEPAWAVETMSVNKP